jgi:hypothetical protein
MDERIQRILRLIEDFFASDATSQEKLHTANQLFKVLAQYNRQVAEARGIGRDSHLTQRMPPEIIKALDAGEWEIVDLWLSQDAEWQEFLATLPD